MKQKKSIAPKRSLRPGTQHAKRSAKTPRPFHKRVLLHPFTVMVLLCAGVLIIGTTIRSFAASYNVTATVPAVLPSSPATITAPGAQQHFSTPQAMVVGNCPAQTYVKLYRNTAFSGAAQCVSNTYQIQTSLSQGSNQLAAQVYNQTDQAGPAGTPVTVYYDQTSVTPPTLPADAPTAMWVSGVESGGYKQGAVFRTSDNPTISGFAPPLSVVTVTFHSDPKTCVTQADQFGWWSCTLDQTLPPGTHTVDVQAVTSDGQTLNFPSFKITVAQGLPSLLVTPSAAGPLLIHADYRYQVRLGNQANDFEISLSGGTPPYTVVADWGDGTSTTLTRSDSAPFTISHSYPTAAGSNKNYTVLIRATDAKGSKALMQLSVVVRGTGLLLVSSTTTLGTILDGLHRWLWLIWPSYIVVVLMTIGYYLGEREEYRHLMAAKKRAARPAGKTR